MGAWYLGASVLLLPSSATVDIMASLISLAECRLLLYAAPLHADDSIGAKSERTNMERMNVQRAILSQMEQLAEALKQRCPHIRLVPMDDRLLFKALQKDLDKEDSTSQFRYTPPNKTAGGTEGDETCCVLSTSASTTGTSVKAVPLSHKNLLYSCASRNHFWEGWIGEEDRVLGWLPMFHVMGMLLDFLNSALYCGGSYAFCPSGSDLPLDLIR